MHWEIRYFSVIREEEIEAQRQVVIEVKVMGSTEIMRVSWLFLLLYLRASWEGSDGRAWNADRVGISYPVGGFSPLPWGRRG